MKLLMRRTEDIFDHTKEFYDTLIDLRAERVRNSPGRIVYYSVCAGYLNATLYVSLVSTLLVKFFQFGRFGSVFS